MKTARQNILEDHGQLGVHKRLSAGKADQRCRQRTGFDLVEVVRDLDRRQVNQAIVLGRGYDIAMPASQIAQRPGIEPERIERFEGYMRSPLALRGRERILELARVKSRKLFSHRGALPETELKRV